MLRYNLLKSLKYHDLGFLLKTEGLPSLTRRTLWHDYWI